MAGTWESSVSALRTPPGYARMNTERGWNTLEPLRTLFQQRHEGVELINKPQEFSQLARRRYVFYASRDAPRVFEVERHPPRHGV